VRGVQGTRAGDRGRAAEGRICDATRRPAEMPTESISTITITMVTSGADARLQDSKRMIQDTCGARHASRQQAERPE